MTSRFTALKQRRPVEGQTSEADGKGARRGNAAYKQFSAYIPNDLYRSLKVRLAETGVDLSEAAEQAWTLWLNR